MFIGVRGYIYQKKIIINLKKFYLRRGGEKRRLYTKSSREVRHVKHVATMSPTSCIRRNRGLRRKKTCRRIPPVAEFSDNSAPVIYLGSFRLRGLQSRRAGECGEAWAKLETYDNIIKRDVIGAERSSCSRLVLLLQIAVPLLRL